MNLPRENWPRLGSYVISARQSAGYGTRRSFAEAIGVTDRTLAKLEGGERVSPDTLAAVAKEVGWTPDSPRRILDGGEPESLAARPAAPVPASRSDFPGDDPAIPVDPGLLAQARTLFPGDRALQWLWVIPKKPGQPDGEYFDQKMEVVEAVRRLRGEAEGGFRPGQSSAAG